MTSHDPPAFDRSANLPIEHRAAAFLTRVGAREFTRDPDGVLRRRALRPLPRLQIRQSTRSVAFGRRPADLSDYPLDEGLRSESNMYSTRPGGCCGLRLAPPHRPDDSQE